MSEVNNDIKILGSFSIIENEIEINDLIEKLLNYEHHCIVSFVNAHGFNLAQTDKLFEQALLKSDFLLRDGIGMKMLFKSLGIKAGLNMNGTDFIPLLLDKFKNSRVLLIGTKDPFLTNAALKLKNQGHNIIDAVDGFQSEEAYVKLILKCKPKVILLGMGMPRQEILAYRIKELIPEACIWINGGAIIDFLGGRVSRAPLWIQKMGMEWLFRLANEPIRLFRRYIIGNVVFVFRFPNILARYKM